MLKYKSYEVTMDRDIIVPNSNNFLDSHSSIHQTSYPDTPQ